MNTHSHTWIVNWKEKDHHTHTHAHTYTYHWLKMLYVSECVCQRTKDKHTKSMSGTFNGPISWWMENKEPKVLNKPEHGYRPKSSEWGRLKGSLNLNTKKNTYLLALWYEALQSSPSLLRNRPSHWLKLICAAHSTEEVLRKNSKAMSLIKDNGLDPLDNSQTTMSMVFLGKRLFSLFWAEQIRCNSPSF